MIGSTGMAWSSTLQARRHPVEPLTAIAFELELELALALSLVLSLALELELELELAASLAAEAACRRLSTAAHSWWRYPRSLFAMTRAWCMHRESMKRKQGRLPWASCRIERSWSSSVGGSFIGRLS